MVPQPRSLLVFMALILALAPPAHSQPERIWSLEGSLTSAALSPDGSLIAISDPDAQILVFNRDGHEPVRTCTGHGEPVDALTFLPNGERIAATGRETSLRVWDASCEQVYRFAGLTGERIAASPDGRLVAVAGRSGTRTVTVVDVSEGRVVGEYRTIPTARVGRDAVEDLHTLAFSPDGSALAAGFGCYDSDGEPGDHEFWGCIGLWDVAEPGPSRLGTRLDYDGHLDAGAVAFTDDDTLVTTTHVLDVASAPGTGVVLQDFEWGLAMTRDGRRMVGVRDGDPALNRHVLVYDDHVRQADLGRLVDGAGVFNSRNVGASFSDDGRLLLVWQAPPSGRVDVWELAPLRSVAWEESRLRSEALEGYSSMLPATSECLAATDDGLAVLCASKSYGHHSGPDPFYNWASLRYDGTHDPQFDAFGGYGIDSGANGILGHLQELAQYLLDRARAGFSPDNLTQLTVPAAGVPLVSPDGQSAFSWETAADEDGESVLRLRVSRIQEPGDLTVLDLDTERLAIHRLYWLPASGLFLVIGWASWWSDADSEQIVRSERHFLRAPGLPEPSPFDRQPVWPVVTTESEVRLQTPDDDVLIALPVAAFEGPCDEAGPTIEQGTWRRFVAADEAGAVDRAAVHLDENVTVWLRDASRACWLVHSLASGEPGAHAEAAVELILEYGGGAYDGPESLPVVVSQELSARHEGQEQLQLGELGFSVATATGERLATATVDDRHDGAITVGVERLRESSLDPPVEASEVTLELRPDEAGQPWLVWTSQGSVSYGDNSGSGELEERYRLVDRDGQLTLELVSRSHTDQMTSWIVDTDRQRRERHVVTRFHTGSGYLEQSVRERHQEADRDCASSDYIDYDDRDARSEARADPCCEVESVEGELEWHWRFVASDGRSIPLTSFTPWAYSAADPPTCD